MQNEPTRRSSQSRNKNNQPRVSNLTAFPRFHPPANFDLGWVHAFNQLFFAPLLCVRVRAARKRRTRGFGTGRTRRCRQAARCLPGRQRSSFGRGEGAFQKRLQSRTGALSKIGDPDVSRAGVIRTLLKQANLKDAADEAGKWKEAEPNNGFAVETWSEVQYRNAELPEALQTALASRKLDPCNPRSLLVISRIQDLLGDHAAAAHHITIAHALAPHDIEIQETWLPTQPRFKRLEAEAILAKDEQLLNAEDRKNLLESLAHQKDYSKSDCQLVLPTDHAEFHMEEMMEDANHRKGFGLYVKFNGSERTLELDSGASGIVLSRAAASRLKLEHEEKFMAGGVGDQGGIQTATAHVDSIRIGGLEFKHCPVAIFEKRDNLGIDGLIGTDFFDKFLVTLEFPARKVRLNPLPKRPGETAEESSPIGDNDVPVFHDRYIAPEMKDWSMIWRSGHDLLLPVSIGAAKDKLFIIDTGAASMLISPAAAREVTKVHGRLRYPHHWRLGRSEPRLPDPGVPRNLRACPPSCGQHDCHRHNRVFER